MTTKPTDRLNPLFEVSLERSITQIRGHCMEEKALPAIVLALPMMPVVVSPSFQVQMFCFTPENLPPDMALRMLIEATKVTQARLETEMHGETL